MFRKEINHISNLCLGARPMHSGEFIFPFPEIEAHRERQAAGADTSLSGQCV